MFFFLLSYHLDFYYNRKMHRKNSLARQCIRNGLVTIKHVRVQWSFSRSLSLSRNVNILVTLFFALIFCDFRLEHEIDLCNLDLTKVQLIILYFMMMCNTLCMCAVFIWTTCIFVVVVKWFFFFIKILKIKSLVFGAYCMCPVHFISIIC